VENVHTTNGPVYDITNHREIKGLFTSIGNGEWQTDGLSWEAAGALFAIDAKRVSIRNSSTDGCTDFIHWRRDCFHCESNNTEHGRATGGEQLATNDSCRFIMFANAKIHRCSSEGGYAPQHEDGPVWYVNVSSPKGARPGTQDRTQFFANAPDGALSPNGTVFDGWSGAVFKINTGTTELPVGFTEFINCVGIVDNEDLGPTIINGAQSALSFGRSQQTHSYISSRNCVWASSGRFLANLQLESFDAVDFEHDHIYGGQTQGSPFASIHPNSEHNTNYPNLASMLATLPLYQEGHSYGPPPEVVDFVPTSRKPGVVIPGVTGNPIFGSPTAETGTFAVPSLVTPTTEPGV